MDVTRVVTGDTTGDERKQNGTPLIYNFFFVFQFQYQKHAEKWLPAATVFRRGIFSEEHKTATRTETHSIIILSLVKPTPQYLYNLCHSNSIHRNNTHCRN